MSLVAYESSSDSEEEQSTKTKVAQKSDKIKQPVKISVPTVEYDSDDGPDSKKPKFNSEGKGSGLLCMLPPPKEQPEKVLTLVPNILKKKSTNIANTKLSENVKISSKKIHDIKNYSENPLNEFDDDSDDDEIVPHFDEELWKKVIAPPKKSVLSKSLQPTESSNEISTIIPEVQIAPDAVKPYDGLDNAAFKELVGKNRKKQEVIDIVDIHEDEIRPDKEEWLKSLTDPNYAPKTVIENPVNDTCKRKHHITYLAQQAKANELELQNQWAANRFARKQTQAKYGF